LVVGEPKNSNQRTARSPGRLQTKELGQSLHVQWFAEFLLFIHWFGVRAPGGTSVQNGRVLSFGRLVDQRTHEEPKEPDILDTMNWAYPALVDIPDETG